MYAILNGVYVKVIDQYVNSTTLERMCVVHILRTNVRKIVSKSSLKFL